MTYLFIICKLYCTLQVRNCCWSRTSSLGWFSYSRPKGMWKSESVVHARCPSSVEIWRGWELLFCLLECVVAYYIPCIKWYVFRACCPSSPSPSPSINILFLICICFKLCVPSTPQAKMILREVGIPWLLDLMNTTEVNLANATQHCFQTCINTLTGMDIKQEKKPDKVLLGGQTKTEAFVPFSLSWWNCTISHLNNMTWDTVHVMLTFQCF